MIYLNKIINSIYLAAVVVQLLSPASAQSEDVTLNMDAHFVAWEASLAYGSYNLSNDNQTNMLSKYADRINIISPVFANELDWPMLIWFDWHGFGFNRSDNAFGFYPLELPSLLQADDQGVDSALPASKFVSLDGELSTAKWDKFTYNFNSVSEENTIPMPTIILLMCLGLIGLAGFARKRTNA